MIAILALLLGSSVQAGDICDYYRKTSPELYRLLCSGTKRSAKPAGANSTFADGFNVNSGSLPTEPTSYGVEAIGSYLRDNTGQWSPTFSLIKGFHKIGTGISTAAENTFYTDDVMQRLYGPANLETFKPLEPSVGHVSNLNVGTALELWTSQNGLSATLGVSARYNKVTDTWGGGPGLLLSQGRYTLGAGFTRERVSLNLPRLYFYNLLASVRVVSFLELEYTYLSNSGLPGASLSPIHIATLNVTLGRILGCVALRHLDYLSTGALYQDFVSLQYLVSRSLSLGAIHNYIPGTNSLAFQYFL